MTKKEKQVEKEKSENNKCECECCNEECNCDESCNCGCNECSDDTCTCNNNEISELTNKLKQAEDSVLRANAELINYRKRKDEEMSRMIKYCNEDVIKKMLPIVDNFERAIKLDNNDLSDELSKFLEGFKMIYTSIVNIFNELDVKAIDGTSKPFDPTYHQGVLTEKIDGVEAGIVIEVLQKGYLYKDRVIRPAMVKVSE